MIKLIHCLINETAVLGRDKHGDGAVQLIEHQQIVIHMLDGNRLTEITFHITGTAKRIYHSALIIITEQSAAVLIQTYIDIIIQNRHILKVRRTCDTAAAAPVQVTVYREFAIVISPVTYQDIGTQHIQLTYGIHGPASQIFLVHTAGTCVDKSLPIHIHIVIFRRNKGFHFGPLFLRCQLLPDIVRKVISYTGRSDKPGKRSVCLIFYKTFVDTACGAVYTSRRINYDLIRLERTVFRDRRVDRFVELQDVVQIHIHFDDT